MFSLRPLTRPIIYYEPELLRQIAHGDTAAFRQLFDHHSRHVYGLSLRLTKSPQLAKDLVQEIFTKLWEGRAALASVEAFRPYLNTIARNHIRDYFRKRVITIDNEAYLTGYFRESSPSPEDRIAFKELEQMVQEAVKQLTPQLREAFILSRTEGLTHQQIAAKMNISITTSKSHIVRALASIRAYLKQRYPHLEIPVMIYLWLNFF